MKPNKQTPTTTKLANLPQIAGSAPQRSNGDDRRANGSSTSVAVLPCAKSIPVREFTVSGSGERYGTAGAIAVRIADAKLYNNSVSVNHSHYCRHCNRTFSCKATPCRIPGKPLQNGKVVYRANLNYDISKIHPCGEAKAYRKRMAIMLGNQDNKCIYNCNKLCNHPMSLNSNEKSSNQFTSRYSIDGISDKDAITAKNSWNKARLEKVSDSFYNTPWLVDIAKDFRNR